MIPQDYLELRLLMLFAQVLLLLKIYDRNPKEISVPVIGGHSGITILPLLSQSGFEFSDEDAAAMTKRIQNAGTEVVEAKAGGGSATYQWGRLLQSLAFL